MKSRVYIVTGSSGIAGETIKILTTAGHKVFFISNDIAQCETLLNELQSMQLNADYITGDLTEEQMCQKLVLET